MLATKPLNPILIKTCMRGILKAMLNLSSLISRSNLFYNRHWIGEDYLTQLTNSTRRLTCSFILNSISLYRIDPRPVNREAGYRQVATIESLRPVNTGKSIVVGSLTFGKRYHTYFQVEY